MIIANGVFMDAIWFSAPVTTDGTGICKINRRSPAASESTTGFVRIVFTWIDFRSPVMI